MTYNQSTRAAVRHLPAAIFAAAVLLNVALIGVLAYQSPPSSWAAPDVAPPGPTAQPPRIESAPKGPLPSAITVADGTVPDGATVFDDEIPAVANLDPNLLEILRNAAADAERDGVEFVVNSGWRPTQYQQQLLRDAVLQYGSEQEAARWVAPPEKSAHVSGDAVDIGPDDAAAWLSANGEKYGLCQTYGNEPWHFELRADTIDVGCPPQYADPTQDPRMALTALTARMPEQSRVEVDSVSQCIASDDLDVAAFPRERDQVCDDPQPGGAAAEERMSADVAQAASTAHGIEFAGPQFPDCGGRVDNLADLRFW